MAARPTDGSCRHHSCFIHSLPPHLHPAPVTRLPPLCTAPPFNQPVVTKRMGTRVCVVCVRAWDLAPPCLLKSTVTPWPLPLPRPRPGAAPPPAMALTTVLLFQVFRSFSQLQIVVFVYCAASRHGNTLTHTHTHKTSLYPPSTHPSTHPPCPAHFTLTILTGPSPSPCGTKLIEDDWFFPGCSDSALETRQQELEEELAQAQVQGLGRHRAKKSAAPSQRSLQVNTRALLLVAAAL